MRSELVFRNDSSRQLAQLLGAGKLGEVVSPGELEGLEARPVRVRAAAMGGSGAFLKTRFGSWLDQADSIELVVDRHQPLDTRGLASVLGERLRLRAYAPEGGGLFHPKVVLAELAHDRGRFMLALVGSANLTRGGMKKNVELGVVHLEVASEEAEPFHLEQWPTLSERLATYWEQAEPVAAEDLPVTEGPKWHAPRGTGEAFDSAGGDDALAEVLEVLEPLPDESIRHLRDAFGLSPAHDAEAIRELAATCGTLEELIARARRPDLIAFLRQWETVEHGQRARVVGHDDPVADVEELRRVVVRLVSDGLIPEHETPVVEGGAVVGHTDGIQQGKPRARGGQPGSGHSWAGEHYDLDEDEGEGLADTDYDLDEDEGLEDREDLGDDDLDEGFENDDDGSEDTVAPWDTTAPRSWRRGDSWRAPERMQRWTVDADENEATEDEEGAAQYAGLESIPVPESPGSRVDAKLEGFQQRAVEELRAHFRTRRRPAGILCLPTGGGKTRTSLQFVFEDFLARKKRVMWVAPRLQLLTQAHEELRGLAWLLHGKRESFSISRFDGFAKNLDGDVIIASSSSLARSDRRTRYRLTSKLSLVVFDEAHRSIAPKTKKGIDQVRGWRKKDGKRAWRPRVPLLGLTATPFRSSDQGTQRLQEYFDGPPVFQLDFGDLVRERFLAKPIFYGLHIESTRGFRLDAEQLEQTQKEREIPMAVLGELARSGERDREIVDHWYPRRARYGKTLVFACNIDHAEALAARFAERSGVTARALHSRLDRGTREEILGWFQQARGPAVLVNVGILTEGANIPTIRTVLMARPTLSPVLYTQMIGRGARGPKTVPDKHTFFVIDCVENFVLEHRLEDAARLVREELGEELASSEPVKPRRPSPSDEELLREALERLAQEGEDPDDHPPYGVLSWGEPPATRAILGPNEHVLLNCLPKLDEALDGETSWDTVHAYGEELSNAHVLSEEDWRQVVEACRRQRQLPVVERWMEPPVLDAPVRESIERKARARRGELQATQLDLGAQARAAQEHLAKRERIVRALVPVLAAVARADGIMHPSEVGAITRWAKEAAQGVDLPIETIVNTVVHGGPIRVTEHAATLVQEIRSPNERMAVLEWAFRVAMADDAYHPDEDARLSQLAHLLELPAGDVRQALLGFADHDRTPARLIGGYMVCPGCGHAAAPDVRFCGHCGTALIQPTDEWVEREPAAE